MLNYETILSSYDDKLTLMQWLKKVEDALRDASATSFDVIKTGNATLKFAITFEDGTSLVSGEIVLQQGESVASGDIRNGHLFLTLTNGHELDCGLLFNGEVPSLEVRSLEVTGGLLVGDDANAAIGGDLVVHGLTEVQNLLAYGNVDAFDKITDANDHKRFIGGNLTLTEGGGLIPLNPYAKWSLSGSHLMIVLAFDVEVGTSIGGSYNTLAFASLPQWILSKIRGFGGGTYLIFEPSLKGYTNNYVALPETLPYSINKSGSSLDIRYQDGTPRVFSVAGTFRISLDLLIDNE